MTLSDDVLATLIPSTYQTLIHSKGSDFVEKIGDEVVRGVLLNVLSGGNLRDATEMVTRRRLSLLNAATLAMFISGVSKDPDFASKLPNIASERLKTRVKKDEKWLLEWVLGLTDKAFQNVLRDDPTKIDAYRNDFIRELARAAQQCETDYGQLEGHIKIDDKTAALDWRLVIQLLTTVGAQTLAIRGSEKSTYGKLFEPLVLGSALTLLGFRQVKIGEVEDINNVFWLSERSKREADATAICGAGKGIRFDIGFIGRGNPEITLDKVSRYEREIEIGRQHYYMATFILVDRIGKESKIVERATDIGGTVIQMSMSYWPRVLAQEMKRQVGYESPIAKMTDSQIKDDIGDFVHKISYESFLRNEASKRTRSKQGALPER